jgi:xylulokinase
MYLGIDCGTQGTKAILFDPACGEVVARAHAPHPIISEVNGRREQKCEWWIAALRKALHELFHDSGRFARDVAAIGVSGQHHGLVLLDEQGQPLRDVKLWNDTETAGANELIVADAGGMDGVWKQIGTTLPVGYTASKVGWVRHHEPELYARTRHVLLPHDYINFWLTGEYVTDAGEASGTGYFDVVQRRWSERMLEIVDPSGVLAAALPRVSAPLEPVGTVRASIAEEFGFRPGTLVACGSGDNVMGAVGTGTVAPGCATIGLGTSGVLNVYAERHSTNVDRNVQIFCGLESGWLATVATMNATSSTTLLRQLFEVEVAEVETLLGGAPVGAQGVRVFPFFSGERMPALPRARGAIKGLTQDNFTRANLMRATAESVVLGLKWGFERLTGAFGRPGQFCLTGGGANSAAWRQILADVFETEVVRVRCDEGGALGAALQALAVHLGNQGVKTSLRDVCDRYVALDYALSARPNGAAVAQYRELFAAYSKTIQEERFDA